MVCCVFNRLWKWFKMKVMVELGGLLCLTYRVLQCRIKILIHRQRLELSIWVIYVG